MWTRSARYYDAIYAAKDYRREADAINQIVHRLNPFAKTLLDVACGTGRHLEHLRSRYRVEGLDLEPEFLAVARERLPGIPLHEGDMATFDLGRTFGAVTCLFSAIGYAGTEEGLDHTIANLARHLDRGGVLLVEPWFTPEQYEHDHVHAVFVDEPGLKIARVNNGGPPGPMSVLEFQYVVGTSDGVEHFTETHELGLFTHERYLEAFRRAGLDAHHDPEGLMGRGLYAGVRPK